MVSLLAMSFPERWRPPIPEAFLFLFIFFRIMGIGEIIIVVDTIVNF